MYIRLSFTIVLLFLSISHRLFSQKEVLTFTNLTIKDGLSQNSVIRIFQDSKGYMWFATRNGLNKYDGSSFDVFTANPQDPLCISSSDVTSITEDRNGCLWIGTHEGLNYFDPVARTFTHFYKSSQTRLSDDCIKHLLLDKQGRLWVGTTKGLDLFNPQSADFMNIYKQAPIVWLIEDHRGKICFTDGSNKLIFYDPDKASVEMFDNPYGQIYCIYECSQNSIWLGTKGDGLCRFDPEKKTFEKINLELSSGEKYNTEQIGDMIEAGDKKKLILATRNGILFYDKTRKCLSRQVGYSTTNEGITDNTVIALYRDKTENIWIGTWSGGVNMYTPYGSNFGYHSLRKSIDQPVGSVASLIECGNQIWIGSDQGLISYDPGTLKYEFHTLSYTHHKASTMNEIKYLYKSDERYFLVNSYNSGLYEFDSHEKKITGKFPVHIDTYIKSIARDSLGNYWICPSVNECLIYYNPKEDIVSDSFQVKNNTDKQKFINVQDVMIDYDHRVWIGTRSNGLYCYNYENKELVQFKFDPNKKQTISSNHVSVIFKDSRGSLWS